jgi:hypothetical protein
LIARTGGNPFFLEESVRTLVETQMLVGERGAYRLTKSLTSLQVPATVQAVLAARIELSAAIALYRAMDITFWLPQAEAALEQVVGSGVPETGSD